MRRSRIAVVLSIAFVLGACAQEAPSDTRAPVSRPAPAFATFAPPATAQQPLLGAGFFAVRPPGRYVQIWRAPDPDPKPRFVFDTVNPFGQQVPLLVAGAKRDPEGEGWLKILLPIRPNEAVGWVKERDVRLVPERERIVIDLSRRVLKHFKNGKLVDRFEVGVGRRETPTAAGTFYVWARVPQADPSGPYGVFALGISGFSEVLKDWPGGGRMAIHGTPSASDRGQAVSHGCIRVYNRDMMRLRRVPLGTPVIIRR